MNNDIQKIEQVLYRACHAVDLGRADDFISLFHPEGTFIISWEESGRYKGREKIREWIANYNKTLRSFVKYLRHKITCPMIDVYGENATVYAYLDVEAAPEGSDQVTITVGHYEDRLIKAGDDWLFKEKIVFMDNMYSIKAG